MISVNSAVPVAAMVDVGHDLDLVLREEHHGLRITKDQAYPVADPAISHSREITDGRNEVRGRVQSRVRVAATWREEGYMWLVDALVEQVIVASTAAGYRRQFAVPRHDELHGDRSRDSRRALQPDPIT
jgi:hypothetical protein